MPTQIDWCNRCAAAVYDEDGHDGACGCPDGQLKQLLARAPARPVQPVRVIEGCFGPVPPPPPRPAPVQTQIPVLAHLNASHVVNPFAEPVPQRVVAGCNCRSRPCSCGRRMTAAVRQEQDFSGFFTRADLGEPAAPTLPVTSLESLWSTEPTDEDFTAGPARVAAEPQLEALWMGQVARETGMNAPDLESLWMSELATPQGTTVASSSNEITFDNDMDAEIANYPQRGGGRSSAAFSVMAPPARSPINGPRVQVGQVGRFAVMAETPATSIDTAIRTASQRPPTSLQSFRDVREQRDQRYMASMQARQPPLRTDALQRAADYANRPTSYQRLMSDD